MSADPEEKPDSFWWKKPWAPGDPVEDAHCALCGREWHTADQARACLTALRLIPPSGLKLPPQKVRT